jgi:nicotinamidase-related amidase
MKDQCIIIIDPQKDFTSEEGAYAIRHPQLREIKQATERIQQLLDRATGYDLIVVYSNYQQDQFGENLLLCIPGTAGHELGIEVSPETIILSKAAHSAFTDAVFAAFIQERKYKRLFLGGFLAEYCVKQTALDALQQGYPVSMIGDCIATGDDVRERIAAVLKEAEENGAVIISADQL